jgi:hypothetical protein
MAKTNPTDGGSLVPLDVSPQHIPILRERLTAWLDGVNEDLEAPDQVQRPDQAWQEAQAFGRLLTALVTGKICVPDDAARSALEVSVAVDDKESGYAEAVSTHDALHELLAVLGGPRP